MARDAPRWHGRCVQQDPSTLFGVGATFRLSDCAHADAYKEVTEMQAVALVLPLLPGKADADREAMLSCWRGDRKDDFQASRERHGIDAEAVWIQNTPGGDVVILYIEADDVAAAFKGVATSEDPFDRWFRDHVRNVHGVNLQDGFTPPEQILDYRG